MNLSVQQASCWNHPIQGKRLRFDKTFSKCKNLSSWPPFCVILLTLYRVISVQLYESGGQTPSGNTAPNEMGVTVKSHNNILFSLSLGLNKRPPDQKHIVLFRTLDLRIDFHCNPYPVISVGWWVGVCVHTLCATFLRLGQFIHSSVHHI